VSAPPPTTNRGVEGPNTGWTKAPPSGTGGVRDAARDLAARPRRRWSYARPICDVAMAMLIITNSLQNHGESASGTAGVDSFYLVHKGGWRYRSWSCSAKQACRRIAAGTKRPPRGQPLPWAAVWRGHLRSSTSHDFGSCVDLEKCGPRPIEGPESWALILSRAGGGRFSRAGCGAHSEDDPTCPCCSSRGTTSAGCRWQQRHRLTSNHITTTAMLKWLR
jgi:hypothetical protein